MKTKIGILIFALSATFFNTQAQRVVTTRAASYDISDNLDLDAVASIFGDSENLEDFEGRLNDPDERISNLDLNEDGYIDYLRVVENSSDRNSLVLIQAVLDKDVYQDVATIEIERRNNGNPRVQIVGDSYIYGSNYIIEPVFVRTPLIFSFFWSPRYVAWNSPYYWNYYPRYYHYYRPYPTYKYHHNVYSHVNRYNTYRRVSERNEHFSNNNYNQIRRNDYASKHPDRAFNNRNEGIRNKQDLSQRRSDGSENYRRNNDIQRSNNSQYRNKQNSDSQIRQKSNNVYKRPESSNESGKIQYRTRESNSRVQPNSNSGNRRGNPEISRSQSTNKPAPHMPQNRIETHKNSSVSSENSGSGRSRVSSGNSGNDRSRSNTSAQPRQQSSKKSSSEKNSSKEESSNRRR